MKKNTEEKSYNKELRSKLFHLLIFFLHSWNFTSVKSQSTAAGTQSYQSPSIVQKLEEQVFKDEVFCDSWNFNKATD